MANTKEYKIVINGLTESINAVDSLNKQLSELENRIKALEKSSVKINTTSSGGGSSSSGSKSSLNEEEKLSRQIAQIDAKREAYSKEIYQNYLAAKDVLNETVKDQKQLAAQERVTANAYSNTMDGIKQKLADLKSVHFTTDISTDEFKQQEAEINSLTNKLKELEEAYGVFSRNVGNYQSAFDGLKKVKVEVGAITREFDNTSKASRTLNQELRALEVNGKGNTQQAKNLREAINNLDSAMKDATVSSRAMDEAMDFMQSFTAMASIGTGIQTFFGFDDNEITKSIQKLVALQGVLNGLENIRKQMDTKEGIGKILGKGFEKIDTWTYGLRKMNVQLRGTGTSARIAAAGIKVLNYALKGLMTLGIGVAIDLLVEGLQKAAAAIKDFTKGDADLITSADVMQNAIDAQNKVLEKNLELIKQKHDAGQITSEQARIQTEREYSLQLNETAKSLMKVVNALQMLGAMSNDVGLKNVIGDKGVTWIGGFSEGIKDLDHFIERFDDLEERVAHGSALKSWLSSASDARDEFVHLTQLVGGDFIIALNKFNDGTEEGTRKLIAYIDQMDKLTSGRYSKAMQIVKFDNEGLQKDIENAWAMIQTLRDNVFKNPIVIKLELDAKIESELDRLDPTRAAQRTVNEWKDLLKKGVDEAGNVLTEAQKNNIKKIIAEQEKNIAKQRQQRLDSERNNAKKLAQEQERAEKELNKLRIENMKEGLDKTLAQLREERRERLQQVKITGIKVNELTAEINELYRKKEEEAIKEHTKECQQLYADMWEQIYRAYDNSARMNLDSELTNIETRLKKAQDAAAKILNPRYMTYGGTQLPPSLNDKRKRELGFDQEAKQGGYDEGALTSAKRYLDILEEIEEKEIELENIDIFGSPTEEINSQLEASKKELEDWASELDMSVDEFKDIMDKSLEVQELIQNGYTKSMTKAFKIRIGESKKYYDEMLQLENDYVEKYKENELKLLQNESNSAQRDEKNRYESQMVKLEEARKKGLISDKDYYETSERMAEEHANAIEAILLRQASETERILGDAADKIKQNNARIANFILNEYEDAYNAASKMASRQPQLMSGALGDLGIIDYKKTKQQLKEARDMLNQLSREIIQKRNELMASAITEEDRQSIKRRFQGMLQDISDISAEIDKKEKELLGAYLQSIAQKVQAFGSTLGSLLQSIGDYIDQQYENEINRLEEEIDKQKEIYDKQEEIANEHKNKLNEIEDELATARGDRRQHLIDQLNAEMAAQRQALAEQKKALKEQQRLEKQKDREEKKRKQDQKKMAMTQAVINGATAFMNALAQQPIWLGIAMAAMTAAMTAVQIATISSAKYAEGGVIQGRSHAQGGVKVLGGQAEVEGGEYITNKATTSQNVELLSFINNKKRKLNIDDFIEFYSNGKTRKNISSMSPGRKFADGGVMPSLRSDISVNDRLLTAFEDYSNRPVQVAVVDINNRQAQVRNVQVMAGLTE